MDVGERPLFCSGLILADDDGSTKSHLLVNMTFPILDLINLLDNPDLFKLIMLKRNQIILKRKEGMKERTERGQM